MQIQAKIQEDKDWHFCEMPFFQGTLPTKETRLHDETRYLPLEADTRDMVDDDLISILGHVEKKYGHYLI